MHTKFLTLLVSALTLFPLWGNGPTPRVTIDAKNEDIPLKKPTRVVDMEINDPSWKEGRNWFHANGIRSTAPEWKKYVFAFTPGKSGSIILRFFANQRTVGTVIKGIEVCDIKADGATLYPFKNWRWKHITQRTDSAPQSFIVDYDYGLYIPVKVKADEKVTLSFLAREAKPIPAPPPRVWFGGIIHPKNYYLRCDEHATLLPLADKGYLRVELPAPDKRKFEAREAQFVIPRSDKRNTAGAFSAPFTFLEESGVGRAPAFLRFGVPLARGIYDLDHFQIVDAKGNFIRAQFSAVGFWPDRSVRSVLVQFQSPFKANETQTFSLRFDPEKASPECKPSPLGFTEKDGIYSIRTGKLTAELDSSNFNLLNNITVDGKKVGSFAPAGLELIPEDGVLRAGSARPAEITVEEQGPERLVFKVKGSYGSDAFCRYVVRIGFYADSPAVTLDIQHINTRTDVEFTDLKSLSFRFIPTGKICKLSMAGIPGKEFSQFTDRIIRYNGKMHNDRQFTGGGEMTADAGKISFAVREMWQRYPKAVRLENNALAFDLLPVLPGKDFGKDLPHYLQFPFCEGYYRTRCGMAFSQKIDFDFSGNMSEKEISALDVIPVYDRDYVASTKAYQGILPKTETAFDPFDHKAQEAFYRHLIVKEQQHEYGFFNYGDWYGERGYNWTNNEYDMAYAMFMLFLRSGNRDAYRWARIAARHQADVDITHAAYSSGDLGNNHAHAIGHTGVGNEHRRTWSWPYGSSALNGHSWSRGMTDAMLLGGDAVSMDAALMLGYHAVHFAAEDFRALGTHERTGGWSTVLLMGMYQATGDQCYLDAAKKIVDIALKAQNFEKGGAWPHKMPVDHAGGHKNTFGNCPYLIGILTEALRQYYLSSPSPALEKSLTAAAQWQLSGYHPDAIGWPYGVSWNGKGYHSPNSMLNFLAAPGMMTGGRLANDERIYKACQDIIGDAIRHGLSNVGKNLAMQTALVPSLIDEMYAYAKQNNLKLSVNDRYENFKGDHFAQRGPTDKEFLVLLSSPQAKLIFKRVPCGSRPKIDAFYTVTLISPDGKKTEKVRNTTDAKETTHEITIQGKPGDVFRLPIHDDMRGYWDARCSGGTVFVRIVPGYHTLSQAAERRYLQIPKDCRRFKIDVNAPDASVKLIDAQGTVRFGGDHADLASFHTPWRRSADLAEAGKGLSQQKNVEITRKPSEKDEIWELHLYSGGHIYLSFQGIPPYVSMKPVPLPEKFVKSAK